MLPALAVAAALKQLAPTAELIFVGGKTGPERALATAAGLPFHAVATGKLRRYFSWANFVDLLRVPLGMAQAWRLLHRLRPHAVFSKGGYAAVPVVVAAGLLGIPVLAHESDATPGLATRLSARFAKIIATSWPETADHFPAHQTVLTGNPVRPAGDAARARQFLKTTGNRPLVFITGGSLGAQFLNELTTQILPTLARHADVVWLTGRGKRPAGRQPAGVQIFEYLDAEYLDVLAAADLAICRAGAGTLAELAAAGRPAILVPLPTAGSRGDQLLNAQFFTAAGAAVVCPQEAIQPATFAKTVADLLADKTRLTKMQRAASRLATPHAARQLAQLVLQIAAKK